MVVLIVESDPRENQTLAALVTRHGHAPLAASNTSAALKLSAKDSIGLILLGCNGSTPEVLNFLQCIQSHPSQPPAIVMTSSARLEDAILMMKSGAYDFWVKPVSGERLGATLERLESQKSLESQPMDSNNRSIITESPNMLQLKGVANRVAASNASIFIQGESGTGKELFARYIHQNSERNSSPFVAINCAALPENLLESELFGYEKGAFTGAVKSKEGKFELAHTGTLLLDEVTEIPVHLQAKLLRVLQENEVDRVGGKFPVSVDVRVIATSNLIMEEALSNGQFRKDLFYRLNVIPLKIPPLRERRQDIDLLAMHFVEKYSRMHKLKVNRIDAQALRMLREHPWPGNVRELENVVQRAVLLAGGASVSVESIIFDHEQPAMGTEIELMSISEMEKRLIHKALQVVDDNRTRAAQILGISVRTLRNKLNEYRQGQLVNGEFGRV